MVIGSLAILAQTGLIQFKKANYKKLNKIEVASFVSIL
ncbi:Uncharacterised protein [Legionella feeleii]|uniref:Uncharacterized protein n=1 Tax=Legionella feeleii TaxID=453 RepID=A0A378KJ63_9GAMM|nr:Uncharacterised protein [Legionella feeleii]